jgi:hypothetical protein
MHTRARTGTNIGCLDHAHVVSAIPSAADALLRKAQDKSGDVCFLRRRAPTHDDCGEP